MNVPFNVTHWNGHAIRYCVLFATCCPKLIRFDTWSSVESVKSVEPERRKSCQFEIIDVCHVMDEGGPDRAGEGPPCGSRDAVKMLTRRATCASPTKHFKSNYDSSASNGDGSRFICIIGCVNGVLIDEFKLRPSKCNGAPVVIVN